MMNYKLSFTIQETIHDKAVPNQPTNAQSQRSKEHQKLQVIKSVKTSISFSPGRAIRSSICADNLGKPSGDDLCDLLILMRQQRQRIGNVVPLSLRLAARESSSQFVCQLTGVFLLCECSISICTTLRVRKRVGVPSQRTQSGTSRCAAARPPPDFARHSAD